MRRPERSARTLGAALLILGMALAACAPTPTPTPEPGPFPRVAVTLPFAPLALAWAQQYTDEAGPLQFDLDVVHASVALQGLEEGDYVIAIGALEPAQGWFASPLLNDPIAILVGGGSALTEVSADELVGLLSGRISDWSTLGVAARRVLPVVPLPEDDLRRSTDEQLMRGTPFASGARLVAGPDQALALIAEEPGAIALVPLSAAPNGSAPLRLDGALPSTTSGYSLTAQVLATGPDEPSGAVRDWLVWIQGRQE